MLKTLLPALSLTLLCSVPTAEAYTVKQGQVLDQQGQNVPIYGVNWFGFETQNHIVHGLWARHWKDMITQIKDAGFTAVRLPFCPATLKNDTTTDSIDASKNPELVGLSALQAFDAVIKELDAQGLYILLDHHRPDCNAISELWYTDTYSEEQWWQDLSFVAQRYADVPRVFGIDIKNEPHGKATWGTGNVATDWNTAAEKAAEVILNVNPELLIFVEGIESSAECSSSINHWWGGNLEPQACTPLNIPADKLVFSPHVYGPDVYQQSYFQDADFPAHLPDIWDQHFGFLASQGHTVIPGEFGGRYGHGGDAKDKIWQDAFVDYLLTKGMTNFFYWSWNPNSGDTGGILQDDWNTVWEDKLTLLRRLMLNEPSTPTPPVEPTPSTTPPIEPTEPTDPTTTPPSTTPTPSLVTGTSVLNTEHCQLHLEVRSQWQNGRVLNLVIHNQSEVDLSTWSVKWRLAEGVTLSNFWNISLVEGAEHQAGPLAWNKVIPAGGQREFGLQLAFSQVPEQAVEWLNLSCGDSGVTPSLPPNTSADYEAGLAAGKALCLQDPAACGLSACGERAVYQPETGALFLPRVGLTASDDTLNWQVYLQQRPDGLVFELKGIVQRSAP